MSPLQIRFRGSAYVPSTLLHCVSIHRRSAKFAAPHVQEAATYDALLDELNKAADEGRAREAQSIYTQLDTLAPTKQQRMRRNTVLKAFANAGQLQDALTWFEKMQTDSIRPNEKGMGKLLEAAAKASATDKAEKFLADVEARFTPDVWMWNMLIDAYAKHGLVTAALQALSKMKLREVAPDLVTFNSLVNASAKGNNVSAAKKLVQEMADTTLQPDVFTYSSLLDAYAAKGDVDAAKGVLVDMAEHAVVPGTVSYTTVIKACAKAASRDGQRAFDACRLLADMRSNMVEQNATSFNMVVEACSRAHELEAARACLALLDGTSGLAADVFSYTSILNALGAQSHTEEAVAWFEHMELERVTPDTIAYNSLLACLAHASEPEKVISYFEKMKLAGVPQTSATYFRVISSLGAAQQADNALQWFQNMLAEKVNPNAYTYQSLVLLFGSLSPPRADLVEWVLRHAAHASNQPITTRTAEVASQVLGESRFAELQKDHTLRVSGKRELKRHMHNAGYLDRRRETRLNEVRSKNVPAMAGVT